MKRRSFLKFLAALPVVGAIVPKVKAEPKLPKVGEPYPARPYIERRYEKKTPERFVRVRATHSGSGVTAVRVESSSGGGDWQPSKLWNAGVVKRGDFLDVCIVPRSES